jgi:hypothetical protein
MINDEEFELFKQQAEKQYKMIGKVWCPYLQANVHFNSQGFEHLLFKGWNAVRDRQEQYARLQLIPIAAKIIGASCTLQEYSEQQIILRSKSRTWKQKRKRLQYFMFSAIMEHSLCRVIVRQIGNRSPHFYCIIPKWQSSIRNGTKSRILYTGNPEKD